MLNGALHHKLARPVSRRTLCKSILGTGLTAAIKMRGGMSVPSPRGVSSPDGMSEVDSLDLAIAETPVSFDGRKAMAMTINGTLPGPIIRLHEHRNAVIRVTNHLKETTSIHWHGLIVPHDMDGVPGVSYAGIRPGQTFTYRFLVRQSGTYWCHSHSGGQELLGIYAPLLIEPAEPEPFAYDRDYVVMLSDWTYDSPEHVIDHLKSQSNYYNFHQQTVGDFFSDASHNGFLKTANERLGWARMRMDPTDLADTSGYRYRFLMNGRIPEANWSALFQLGEKVRFRFINASAMMFFDVRIPGLPLTVVAADGQYVKPVKIEEFRMGPAETYDVVVTPQEDRAFTIFAETMDRTGYASGTLAPRSGMAASLPPRRKSPVRSMGDMGMSAMSGMPAPDTEGSKAAQSPKTSAQPGMTDMPGMKNQTEKVSMENMPGQSKEDLPRSGMETVNGSRNKEGGTWPSLPDSPPLNHGSDHHGPGNSAVPAQITSRLHEPGVGLGSDGWRVLLYTDLKALKPYPDRRNPGRQVELHLTGNMDRYMWSFDGKKYSDAKEPIQLQYGERVRLSLVNDTMMEHPIHLHGMWMELENGAGEFQPRKHTISVKPAERITVAVTADAPGRWAMHCHLLLHMDMGMFRVVEVTGGMQYMNEPGRLSTMLPSKDKLGISTERDQA